MVKTKMVSDKTVMVDTCSIINLIKAESLLSIGAIKDHRFTITNDVASEVIRPHQQEELNTAVSMNIVQQISVTDIEELKLVVELTSLKLGLGESSCIAVAQSRGWCFCTDELGRCKEIAKKRLGQNNLLDTNYLLELIKKTQHNKIKGENI
jgi:predicted nucleic acid-binding protein